MFALHRVPLVAALVAAAPLPGQQGFSEGTAKDVASVAPQEALLSITAQELEEFAQKLASDEFAGRLTGTPGQIKAAQLFASEFERLGLNPLGDRGEDGGRGYFQEYAIRLRGLEAGTTGLFSPEDTRIHEHGAWFLPRRAKGKIEIESELVFARHTSLKNLDVEGKIVVMPVELGRDKGGDIYRAMGSSFRLLGLVRSHARRAYSAKAKACILLAKQFPRAFLVATNMSCVFPGKPKVSRPGRGGGISFGIPPKIPTLALAGDDCKGVLTALGLTAEVAFDPRDETANGKRSEAKYRLVADNFDRKTTSPNTCAYLEGSDPELKHEAIVYSCHMDHMGRAANGGFFYGADDNASGSSTVLEIAEAFASLPKDQRPKRSVIFLAVSGEELGLWGSDHFARNPTWELDKIIANINIDMIGRSTKRVSDRQIAVTPTFAHDAYSTIAREAAWLGKALDLRMTSGDRFYQRSDHYNFAKRGVPVVFFVDDEHADYHMPSDTWQKLEYGKMERIAKLAFLVGYRAANAKDRPRRLGPRDDWFEDK